MHFLGFTAFFQVTYDGPQKMRSKMSIVRLDGSPINLSRSVLAAAGFRPRGRVVLLHQFSLLWMRLWCISV